MFVFSINNEFKGFWGNRVGDIFFDLTCNSMKWDRSNVSLHYFKDFHQFNNEGNISEFSDGKLIFYKMILDLEGNIVGKGEKESEIIGELFAENGLLHKAC